MCFSFGGELFTEFWKNYKSTRGSSDKSFGILCFTVFILVFFWRGKKYGIFPPSILAVSLLFLLLSFTFPKLLHPLNRAWLLLGLAMGEIVNPIVIGLVFYFIFCPFALVVRSIRGDRMGLKLHADRSTYWQDRISGEGNPENFRQQY